MPSRSPAGSLLGTFPAGPRSGVGCSGGSGCSAEVHQDLQGARGEDVLHGGPVAALVDRGLLGNLILALQSLALEGAGLDRARVGGEALRVDVDREVADAGVEVG